MVRVYRVLLNGGAYYHITNYCIPKEVEGFYNANGPFDLYVSIGFGTRLYVPAWLRCSRGNPIHLNQQAPPELAALGWKWACYISSWNEATHTYAALLNLIDQYFRGYPNSQ
jgi:hypothetical protein